MSDLVNRDAVLAILSDMIGFARTDVLVDAIGAVRELPAASPWHRVEEPPKKDGKYLVCWKDGGGFCYDTAWWTSVGTWSLTHWTGVTVTHWMTVEPPKEEA